jgi:cytochrome c553
MTPVKKYALGTTLSLCWLALATAANADPLGQKVYAQGGGSPAAMACTNCHAANGMGMSSTGFPRLAGLPEGYLAKQLEDFRKGLRSNAVMQPIASALSDAESKAVTGFLAAMEPTAPAPAPAGNAGSAAEKLATQGDWSRNIPACTACHGEGNKGVGQSFPPLIGQSAGYLASQLNAWRNGTRKNDPNNLMSHIAVSLSDAEIKDVTAYFASLGEESKP